MLGAECANQATEDHVDGRGVERRGNEDEDGLEDEATDGSLIIVAPDSTAVSEYLNCKVRCQSAPRNEH